MDDEGKRQASPPDERRVPLEGRRPPISAGSGPVREGDGRRARLAEPRAVTRARPVDGGPLSRRPGLRQSSFLSVAGSHQQFWLFAQPKAARPGPRPAPPPGSCPRLQGRGSLPVTVASGPTPMNAHGPASVSPQELQEQRDGHLKGRGLARQGTFIVTRTLRHLHTVFLWHVL